MDEPDTTKLCWARALVTPQFIITLLLLGLAVYATVMVLTGSFSDDLKAAVITAIVITGIAELRKYWLTSTSDSDKKNDTINTLAKGKEQP